MWDVPVYADVDDSFFSLRFALLRSQTMEIDDSPVNAAAPAVDNGDGLRDAAAEEPAPEASTSSSRAYIQANDAVLLQLPSETVRLIRLSESNAINLGRYGSFLTSELVGQPYGATFEVIQSSSNNSEDNSDAAGNAEKGDDDHEEAVVPLAKAKGKGKGKEKEAAPPKGKKHQVKAKDLCKLKRKDTDSITLEEIIQTDATNELIKATGAKTLAYDEIMDMKKQGVSGQVSFSLSVIKLKLTCHAPGNHRTPNRRARSFQPQE